MASSKGFKDYILEQLRGLDDITCKPMMGEYILYYQDVIFGGIYDDRLLIKKTKSNEKYNLDEEIPYPSAKPMYMVDNVDNADYLSELVRETYKDLKRPNK